MRRDLRSPDRIGERYGRLTVKEVVYERGVQTRWVCECDCGNVKTVLAHNVAYGRTKSCGCYEDESRFGRKTTHGMTDTRLYRVWSVMKDRCYRKNNSVYYAYGGKGVRVCDEWLRDFKAFYDWSIANGYTKGLSIDRIDPNGNYCPENCRWATLLEQANNKTNSRTLSFDGAEHTLSEWARLVNKSPSLIRDRLSRGWDAERALFAPVKKHKIPFSGTIEYDGESHSIAEWSRKTQIEYYVLCHRLSAGWPVSRALTEPIRRHKEYQHSTTGDYQQT